MPAGRHSSTGLFGLRTSIQPDRLASGPRDYDDLGVDASCTPVPRHAQDMLPLSPPGYIRERDQRRPVRQRRRLPRKATLNEFRLNASYYYDQTWGISAGRFPTWAARPLRWPTAMPDGSPNTSGYVLQADWTSWGKEDSWAAPWANLGWGCNTRCSTASMVRSVITMEVAGMRVTTTICSSLQDPLFERRHG
ncbi:MAG: hypothetical protein R3E45_04365 [Rhodocyclaceae bacterium]